ncbi:MAG TPA: hypothetical protein VF753_08900 [Terriglobales bacterium]
MNSAQANSTITTVPGVPMKGVWTTIRDYILWSYERGTIQYDVMVTLILLFVFLSPYWINYRDKPVEHNPHRTGVVVTTDGKGGFIYQIEARAVNGQDDKAIRSQLLSVIEPIAGEVTISNYEAVRDQAGNVQAYKVWVQR